MWGNSRDVSISEVGRNKILINFKDSRTGKRFLNNDIGNLLNLQQWLYGEFILDVSHDHMEFWVQVHGIPIEHLKAETAKTIEELIGMVGEVKNPTKDGTLKRNFLNFRVAINITQPIQTGFWFNKGNKPKMDELQDCFCFKCEIVGFKKKICSKPQAMAYWDPSKPIYTSELGTK
ncbi:hypothetical protein Ahy_B03g061968 [Arachis hypogaea]|uniref:Uncharacterized protein n=1 Tax=Arachis hypogaea TaxID=3818 RepID=A0A444ZSX7_ARAHY|nr:hypothetical protein Ahy_B03g061968 [Arachis hypogaea]